MLHTRFGGLSSAAEQDSEENRKPLEKEILQIANMVQIKSRKFPYLTQNSATFCPGLEIPSGLKGILTTNRQLLTHPIAAMATGAKAAKRVIPKEGPMATVSASGSNAVSEMQKTLFTKMDTDKNGALSKDEFVSGRPKHAKEADAAKAYERMDSGNTGAVTLEQFSKSQPEHGKPEGKTSFRTLSAMMDLQRGGAMPSAGQPASAQPASAADLYADMDSDGNGTVTKDEFLSARPDNMSEAAATSFYDSIDTQGTGSISEDQFESTIKSKGEHGGHGGPRPMGPPPGGQAPDASSTTASAAQQILATTTAETDAA